MTRYDDILARLRAAAGPDRGLDGRIAYSLGWRFNGLLRGIEDPKFDKWEGFGGHWHQPGGAFCRVDQSFDGDLWPEPPEWTASIDAALALVAEKLPGWRPQFRRDPSRWFAAICKPGPVRAGCVVRGFAQTAPLAILIALFEALKAEEIA